MISNQDFLVVLYNILFLSLFLLWIYREKFKIKQIANTGNLRNIWILSVLFLIFSFIFNLFILVTDVDDAIISGTKAFIIEGKNPYVENVVVHLLNDEEIFGLYHYFPSDLLVYSLFFIVFSPLEIISPIFSGTWFLIGNLVFLILSYLLVRKIVNQPDIRLIPPYVIVTSMFLFTNSILMVLYFTIGYYFFKIKKNVYLGVLFYILAAGVKYMTGLLLLVHVLEELIKVRSIKDLRFLFPYILGSVVFLLMILPFGIFEVLNATFLYQGDIVARAEVAGIYGPILVELVQFLNLLEFFNIFFIVSGLISLIIALFFGKNTYEKQMILSFLFMFILPFYGTELIVVSILLWLFSIYNQELNFPETSSHFKEATIHKFSQ